jgi:glycine cleavage system pyridoxal-binding protein P
MPPQEGKRKARRRHERASASLNAAARGRARATVAADAVATRVVHEPGSAVADVGVVGDATSETTAGVGWTSEGTHAG